MGIIYKATFSNGKSYVGYTKKILQKRKNEHLKSSVEGSNFIFHKAIRKYGFDDLKWEVLQKHDDEMLLQNYHEGVWIKEEKSHFTENGYNMTWGGEGGSNEYWKSTLSENEWEDHIQVLKHNLSKTWKSQKRFNALKESWKNEDRKNAASERMKNIWRSKDKFEIGEKISNSLKKSREDGKYTNEKEHLKNITEKAKLATKGSKWYNDGVKNYRLFETDERISKLHKGKI